MALQENLDDILARITLNPSKPAFGIDLGTTNSAIGYFNNGKVEIIIDSNGDRTVPSYVAYSQDPPLVGKLAHNQMKKYHKKVAYDAKRMIGLDYKNSAIQQNKDFWMFDVIQEKNRPVYAIEDGLKVLPEEVSSEVLKKLKQLALERLEIPKDDNFQAVITVPDYFSQAQKQGTLDAAKLAGIDVLTLITEPTAAALAYGFDHNRFDNYNIFVFDMGGGTCDISVLKVKGGQFEVVGRAGDNQLGGRDFDNLLMNYYARKIKNRYNYDVFEPQNISAKIRLRQLCENIKKELSVKTEDTLELSDIKEGFQDEYISYDVFRREVKDLIVRSKQLCERAIKDSKLELDNIDEVLLVGGSSRMKIIKEMLKDLFTNKTLKESINPDEAVAYGATIRAAQLLDETVDSQVLMEKIPIGIGIALVEDRYEIMLRRNTSIPSEKVTKYFKTVYNYQNCMTFEVFEGERLIASRNTLIGEFSLQVPEKFAEEISVPLTMFIDKNGILHAYAEYRGKREELTINPEKMVSGDKVEEMLNALEVNRQTDKADAEAKRVRTELRKNIEYIKFACEKEVSNNTNHLLAKIKEIDEWLSSTDEPLTSDVREKYISIEDEAKILLAKYHKTLTSFKENK